MAGMVVFLQGKLKYSQLDNHSFDYDKIRIVCLVKLFKRAFSCC